MKSRNYLFIFVLFLPFFVFMNNPVSAQTGGATVTGKITIEASSTQQRVYRGRAYRSGGTVEAQNKTSSTPYQNTIISAQPLSFNVETKPLSQPVKIRQENATFIPHITPVTVGSTVQFINDDPFYHNVFSLTPGAKFNIGRRPTGDVATQRVPRVTGEVEVAGVGEIQLFCDIHSQMNAQILSLETPYFVRVNEDGTYTLSNLPAGTYKLRAFNPNYAPVNTKITIKENEEATQSFKLSN